MPLHPRPLLPLSTPCDFCAITSRQNPLQKETGLILVFSPKLFVQPLFLAAFKNNNGIFPFINIGLQFLLQFY